jgi:hypothetical protein
MTRWWGLRPRWWFLLSAGMVLAWASTYAHTQLFAPDTGSYLWHSLWYGGTGQSQALCQAHDFLQQHEAIQPSACPSAPNPFNESFQRSRVLYPLLSVPFVLLFGNGGILAVPLLAAVVAVVGMTVLLARVAPEPVAVLVSLGAFATAPLLTISLSALTEGPVLALEVAVLLLLPLRATGRGQPPGPADTRRVLVWVAIGLAVTAIGLTRQATPVISGMIAFGWLAALVGHRRGHGSWIWRTGWTGPLVAAVVGNLASLLWLQLTGASQTTLAFQATGASSWPEALRRYPGVLASVARGELLTAWKYPLLLLAVGLALVWLFRRPLSVPAMMLVGAALGVIVLQVGSPYATFLRVESAGVPAVLLAIGCLLGGWSGGWKPVVEQPPEAVPTEPPAQLVPASVESSPERTRTAGFADGVQQSG